MECSLATGFWLQDTLVTAGDRSKNEVVSDLWKWNQSRNSAAELYILFIYNSLITPSPSSFYLVLIKDIWYIVADATF